MRVLQVVGPKDSGKTSFCRRAVQGLRKRGYRVGYVKSVGEPRLDLRSRDTGRVPADVRAGVAESETVLFLPELEVDAILGLLSLLGIDYAVVEGFGSRELGVRVGFCGRHEGATIPVEELEGAPEDAVVRYAVKYTAEADCGRCGYDSCHAFRRAVARGEASPDDCRAPELATVLVDERPVPLNPFVERVVRNVVAGLVSSLRGGEGDRALVAVRL